MLLLLIQREEAAARLLEENLGMLGYQTVRAAAEEQALAALAQRQFDAALWDEAEPDGDAALRAALSARRVPVLPIAAGEEGRTAEGVNAGGIAALLPRLKALAYRDQRRKGILSYQSLRVDEDAQAVTLDGRAVPLKQMEYHLLLTLLRSPGVTWTRKALQQQVWGDEAPGSTRTVDVHIAALRRKLGLARELATVYRVGYRFEPRGPVEARQTES